VAIANLSDSTGTLVVTGPRARAVLQPLTAAPLADAAFAWRTAQELTIADCAVRALRLSLAGELGWELHAPMASCSSSMTRSAMPARRMAWSISAPPR
jgi:dimethylglycine dehydrogenase